LSREQCSLQHIGQKLVPVADRLGLDESPLDPMTLMVTIADLRSALGK
jgi:hypothetical protein